MIVKRNADETRAYLSDASNLKGTCDAVVFPENEADVVEALKRANELGERVTVAGAGTGLAGARTPMGGTVLATDNLDKIIEIDERTRLARVEPGVPLFRIQERARELGLFFPPSPTEEDCYVGGVIAANASGGASFKYGAVRNYVKALRVVLPTGDTVTIRRGKQQAKERRLVLLAETGGAIAAQLPCYESPEVKNAAGYFVKPYMDAIDLFVGAEGTLGVIVEATIELAPLPEELFSCVAFFPSEKSGLDFLDEARDRSRSEAGVSARTLEYFDGGTLKLVGEKYPGVPADAGAAIWFEEETTPEEIDEVAERWVELIVRHGGDPDDVWASLDENDRRKVKEFRHDAPAAVNEYIAANDFKKLGTDVAVPVSEFRDYYEYVKRKIEWFGLRYVIYGHGGDCHLHANMLPENNKQFLHGRECYRYLCIEAVRRGGTVSAEHGIGKLKRGYLVDMYGVDAVREMAALKATFDPKRILNVGVMFDESFFPR